MEPSPRLRLRRLVKTALASALHETGTDRWLARRRSDSGSLPLILCYHRVVEDFDAHADMSIPGLLISRRTLEQHLEWLGRRFDFISLDELGARLKIGKAFDKPAVAITFDDGYRDFYDNAFPLLVRKGIPAAIFVPTSFIGSSSALFYDRLYLLLVQAYSQWDIGSERLARLLDRLSIQNSKIRRHAKIMQEPFGAMWLLLHSLPQSEIHRMIHAFEEHFELDEQRLQSLRPLTWEMLAEMQRHGVTVGGHTHTHALLTNESFQKILDETIVSRQELERRLGIRAEHFAYPCGGFNPLVLSAVAASGYCYGYTTCDHRDPVYSLLTLPRKSLWENSCLDFSDSFSQAILSCQVHRLFDFADRCMEDHVTRPFDRPSRKWDNSGNEDVL